MNKVTVPLFLTLIFNFMLAKNTISAPFFEEDFEAGVPAVLTGNPVWSLPPIFEKLYGTGNTFELTSNACHSGSKSLRFNYNGRNGFCNTCGTSGAIHTSTDHDNASYFVTNDGRDLSLADGAAAAPGRIIFNKSNGFSQWEVTSVANEGGLTNNRLNLKLLHPGIGGETPEFNGGDEIAIARQCGVDGKIGIVGGLPDLNRRNDCDAAITWFQGVDTTVQGPGDSVWRRVYLKPEISSGTIHQKLHYWRTDNQLQNSSGVNLYFGGVVLFADSSNNRPLEPEITGFNLLGGDSRYSPEGSNLPGPALGELPIPEFERSKWYYIEEEFKAATEGAPDPVTGLPTYNPDGEYRLWFAESSEAIANPEKSLILDLGGLKMAALRDKSKSSNPNNSFWGNIQHWTHTIGYWYIDDMFITSDSTDLKPDGNGNLSIGPVVGSCDDLSPPKSPKITN